jgi:hypothetical protein
MDREPKDTHEMSRQLAVAVSINRPDTVGELQSIIFQQLSQNTL